jgi:hypothetical protein
MSGFRENKNIILLDYYEGAYGPTIRIDVQSIDTLNKVKDLFLNLSKLTVHTTIDFIELPSVKAYSINQLLMKRTPDNQEPKKKLELVPDRSGDIVFCWAVSSDGWQLCADLVDGMLDANCPGHQYLTQEGVDDAIVELAFME